MLIRLALCPDLPFCLSSAWCCQAGGLSLSMRSFVVICGTELTGGVHLTGGLSWLRIYAYIYIYITYKVLCTDSLCWLFQIFVEKSDSALCHRAGARHLTIYLKSCSFIPPVEARSSYGSFVIPDKALCETRGYPVDRLDRLRNSTKVTRNMVLKYRRYIVYIQYMQIRIHIERQIDVLRLRNCAIL